MIRIHSKGAAIDEKEVTAYIQQQMVELTPHLKEKSALQVKLTKKKEGFEAELTAYQPEGEVQTVGFNKDVYHAIRNAKEGLLEYFVEFEEAMNPLEREEKIKYLSKHGNLYLH